MIFIGLLKNKVASSVPLDPWPLKSSLLKTYEPNRAKKRKRRGDPQAPVPKRDSSQFRELRPRISSAQSQLSGATLSGPPPPSSYQQPQQPPQSLSEMPPPSSRKPQPQSPSLRSSAGPSNQQQNTFGSSGGQSSGNASHSHSFDSPFIGLQSQHNGGFARPAEGSGLGTLPDNQNSSATWSYQEYKVKADGTYTDTYPPGTRLSGPLAAAELGDNDDRT
jgi:hypothetical protein